METIVKRYEMIEQPSSGARGNQLSFDLLQQLSNNSEQDIIVQGIEFFTAQETPLTATGATVISLANLQKCFLTLYVIDIDSAESVRRIPLIRMKSVRANLPESAADTFWVENTLGFQNLQIIWEKSYIELPGGWAAVNASVLMGVLYKKLQPGTWQVMQKNVIPGW